MTDEPTSDLRAPAGQSPEPVATLSAVRRRPRPRWLVAAPVAATVVVGGGILVGLAGCGPSSSKPSTFTATGTVVLGDALSIQSVGGAQCQGKGDDADITAGVPVVITDKAGRTVATTHLGQGTFFGASCLFTFQATVPADRSAYEVSVAHRAPARYTQQDLRRGVRVSL